VNANPSISTSVLCLFMLPFALSSFQEKIVAQEPTFHKIPSQEISFQLSSDSSLSKIYKLEVEALKISDFISYGEYEGFLNQIREDSTLEFYNTLLPDREMCLPKCYNAYVHSNAFNEYPVVGISWDAAMHYAKWLTLKNNPKKIELVYRLPKRSEWISALKYLGDSSDLNHDYSDWTMTSHDESVFGWNEISYPLDYIYYHKIDDPLVLKRKKIIGNSFRYQIENFVDSPFYGYSDHGYRDTSFRIVKEFKKSNNENQEPFKWLFKYWDL